MSEPKRYCEGIDCSWCDEKEPCIYKIANELQEEIDQLKAENEGLKEQIKKHNDDMCKNPPEKRFYCRGCTLPYISKKHKQALEEIKEIAEEDCKQCFEIDGFSKPDDCGICPYNKILQKISEVVDENN